MKKRIAIMLLGALLLTGCTSEEPKLPAVDQPEPTRQSTQQSTQAEPVSVDIDTEAAFTDADRNGSYDESKSALIRLSGSSVSCESDAVRIDGTTVTITDEGTYILTGTLDDGQIVVNAAKEDKTRLVLRNAHITSATSAPIYVLQADKVFLTLDPGTQNTLQNGGSFVAVDENNIDAVIFSKEDISLNGTGDLLISSPAGHGIVSKDELTVAGGNYTVNCASHGLAGKDSVCVAEANLQITAGKDGIHAENNDDAASGYVYVESGTFTISAEGDGISAASSMQIDDGSFTVTTGGGSKNASKQTSDNWGGFMGGGMGGGMGGRPGRPSGHGGGNFPGASTTVQTQEDSTSIKGIKAGGDLAINGGSFTMDCADDAVHSNSNVTLTGGSFCIATGDDGFHADETLSIQAGTIQITESYEGLEGLHVQVSGGDVVLVASDDGINAAGGTDQSGFGGNRGDMFGGRGGGMGGMQSGSGSILISGGNLSLQASGDGIDANGTLEITGGYTVVCGPTQGDTATLDYDRSAVITGGTFIGTGASGMAQNFSDAQQGLIALRVGNCAAGTQILLTDSNGNTLIDHTPQLNFAVVILSCPEMVSGQEYTLTIGQMQEKIQAS